jgi:hypothetical protein
LRADLCAPTWELQGKTIRVEGREDIVKRIGRSPDYGSAYVLALIDTPKRAVILAAFGNNSALNYDPLAQVDGFHNRQASTYDPFAHR